MSRLFGFVLAVIFVLAMISVVVGLVGAFIFQSVFAVLKWLFGWPIIIIAAAAIVFFTIRSKKGA